MHPQQAAQPQQPPAAGGLLGTVLSTLQAAGQQVDRLMQSVGIGSSAQPQLYGQAGGAHGWQPQPPGYPQWAAAPPPVTQVYAPPRPPWQAGQPGWQPQQAWQQPLQPPQQQHQHAWQPPPPQQQQQQHQHAWQQPPPPPQQQQHQHAWQPPQQRQQQQAAQQRPSPAGSAVPPMLEATVWLQPSGLPASGGGGTAGSAAEAQPQQAAEAVLQQLWSAAVPAAVQGAAAEALVGRWFYQDSGRLSEAVFAASGLFEWIRSASDGAGGASVWRGTWRVVRGDARRGEVAVTFVALPHDCCAPAAAAAAASTQMVAFERQGLADTVMLAGLAHVRTGPA